MKDGERHEADPSTLKQVKTGSECDFVTTSPVLLTWFQADDRMCNQFNSFGLQSPWTRRVRMTKMERTQSAELIFHLVPGSHPHLAGKPRGHDRPGIGRNEHASGHTLQGPRRFKVNDSVFKRQFPCVDHSDSSVRPVAQSDVPGFRLAIGVW